MEVPKFLASSIIAEVAPELGLTVHIEPEYGYVGQIRTSDGRLPFLTPVPGGIGPLEMLILAERLMHNIFDPKFTLQFNVSETSSYE